MRVGTLAVSVVSRVGVGACSRELTRQLEFKVLCQQQLGLREELQAEGLLVASVTLKGHQKFSNCLVIEGCRSDQLSKHPGVLYSLYVSGMFIPVS